MSSSLYSQLAIQNAFRMKEALYTVLDRSERRSIYPSPATNSLSLFSSPTYPLSTNPSVLSLYETYTPIICSHLSKIERFGAAYLTTTTYDNELNNILRICHLKPIKPTQWKGVAERILEFQRMCRGVEERYKDREEGTEWVENQIKGLISDLEALYWVVVTREMWKSFSRWMTTRGEGVRGEPVIQIGPKTENHQFFAHPAGEGSLHIYYKYYPPRFARPYILREECKFSPLTQRLLALNARTSLFDQCGQRRLYRLPVFLDPCTLLAEMKEKGEYKGPIPPDQPNDIVRRFLKDQEEWIPRVSAAAHQAKEVLPKREDRGGDIGATPPVAGPVNAEPKRKRDEVPNQKAAKGSQQPQEKKIKKEEVEPEKPKRRRPRREGGRLNRHVANYREGCEALGFVFEGQGHGGEEEGWHF